MACEHHLNILAEDLPARHVSCPVGSSPQGIPSFRHWDLLGPQHPRPRYKCGVPDAKLGAQCGMLKVFASKTFEYCAREASQVQLWGSGGWPLGILGRKRMSDLVSSAVSRYSQRILKVQKTPTDEQFCKPPFFYLTFAPKTHNFPPEWPKTKVSSNFSLKNIKQTYIISHLWCFEIPLDLVEPCTFRSSVVPPWCAMAPGSWSSASTARCAPPLSLEVLKRCESGLGRLTR